MAIKSSSSTLVKLLVSSSLLLSACSTIKTRDEVREEKRSPQPVNTLPSGGSSGSVTGTTRVPEPPQAPVIPSTPLPDVFDGKELPKVGIILGPGGLKTYAHIGVMKEVAHSKIRVHNIVGLEWGAIMAGIYAVQGQANEVEWKAFKLTDDDIPGSGLISKAIQPEKASKLNSFLNTVFGVAKIEKARVEFACPTYNLKTDKLAWWKNGNFKDGVKGCAAYPPSFVDTDGWMAAPFAVEDAAAYLRARGANLVIYVNVLGGELFNSQLMEEHYAEYILWSEARRQASRKQIPGVNLIINVGTGDYGMTDLDGRRQMMEAGSKASRDTLKKLADQYGF
jgi:NTE family protein